MGLLGEVLDISAPYRVAMRNRSLLRQFVKRNVAVRYRGSMLGLVWSFVQPLMMLSVYTFVFSVVFKARWGEGTGGGRGAFAIIIFCGMAVFNIFSGSVSSSCSVVVSNRNLVKKVIFPLEVLPLAQVISTLVLGMVWFVLLFLGELLVFGKISFTMLLLPVLLLPLFLFTLGISYFVASLGVYMRDTQHVVRVILQVLHFMTPIFYPLQAIPERFHWVMRLNPLTILVEEARQVFLFGHLPDWKFLGLAFLTAIIVLQLGFVWFNRTKKGFADVL